MVLPKQENVELQFHDQGIREIRTGRSDLIDSRTYFSGQGGCRDCPKGQEIAWI